MAVDDGRVAAELLFQVIPAALGWTESVDVGLSRTLFSWTLHAIVYFWLFPAYIAFYTMVPQAAGGRLYSDTMGRLAFILFLIYGCRSACITCSWTRSIRTPSSSCRCF